ncbi:competence/damage-inducible protein A [Tissierellaceae bacterium HCP3S3_D8]
MIAEIITIGTEITTGSTLNTNAKYLASKLLDLGIETYYQTSVDDDPNRLTDVINIALNRADLILTTGGLGPTRDDLTKEVISEALGLQLETDSIMEEKIKDMFSNMNRKMTENNKKQAQKPNGADFIENTIGTAPGIFINHKNKKIIMMPGPPREMKLMFEKSIVPLIAEDYHIISKSINTIGIGESSLETRLLEMNLNTENTSITTFPSEGEVEIKIISKGKDRESLKKEMDITVQKIQDEFGKFIYGYDNVGIENAVVDLLRKKEYRLGLCESCTGGLISSKITAVPGASLVFDRCIVSYSNDCKMEELNVREETLKKYGAVSEETAYEMAKGLIDKSNLNLVLSITGIAGPDGGTKEKPIGLVYICVMTREKYKVVKYNFNGNRTLIQIRATMAALNEIRKILME